MIKACPALSEMGAVVNTPMAAPAGAARSPVVLSYAKAWPSPFAVVVKMPGDAGTTLTLCGADVPLPRVTTMFTVPLLWPDGSTLNGSCALICPDCPEPTKYSPALMSLKVTDITSLNVVDIGMVSAKAVEAARFVPKMDTREPGATPPAPTVVCACARDTQTNIPRANPTDRIIPSISILVDPLMLTQAPTKDFTCAAVPRARLRSRSECVRAYL